MASSSSSSASGMELLLPLVNKLQESFDKAGLSGKIDLPQIAVVGSQSAGKSSVLEHIVGRDFLPRGTGIVTRRPLVLQLLNADTAEDSEEDWAEFSHQPGKRYKNFDEIRQEIEDETVRLLGDTKSISAKPIFLKIVSQRLLPLTLVDLPGLTKVPVEDQPADIDVQITEMVKGFVSRPNCIILAITPANSDIANSDSLRLAREIDPAGERTLGVLTKIDLMDSGTDAVNVLEGKVYPLRLGYVGVINRSQQDIKNGKSIQQAHESERIFFETNEAYKQIAHRMGTNHLARKLNQLLLEKICLELPDIRRKIERMLVSARRTLESCGWGPGGDTDEGSLLLSLLTQFCQDFKSMLSGGAHMSTTELVGAARIQGIFHKIFGPELDSIDSGDGLTDSEISTCIRNSKGLRSALFVSNDAFEMLVKRQVGLMKDPCLQCVVRVADEMQRVAECCTEKISRYPVLKERIMQVVNQLFEKMVPQLESYITNTISIHQSFVNIFHPDFFEGGTNLSHLSEQMQRFFFQDGPNSSFVAASSRGGSSSFGGHSQTLSMDSGSAMFGSGSAPAPPPRPGHSQSRPGGGSHGTEDPFVMVDGSGREMRTFQPPQQQHQQLQQFLQPSPAAEQQQAKRGSEKYSPRRFEGSADLADRDIVEVDIVRALLREYFVIVKKIIKDMVPKATMRFFVMQSQVEIDGAIISTLYHKEENIEGLLKEDEDVVQKRKQAKEHERVLLAAIRTIEESRNFRF